MKHKGEISIYGKTDMGRVRTNNEDAFVAQSLWDEDTFLAIAIDGVGGYEGGEIAADIARKTIPEFLSVSSNGERIELLKQAVTAANNAIFEAREADPEHGQMSCVLTAAIIDIAQQEISMAHVGDSRLYSFHHGELKKLSHDHSLIGYREEIGDLTEDEAMHHPQRNVIGRDLGSQKHKANDDEFIEAQVFPLLPNTTLLFCSDGLSDMITSSTITAVLSQSDSLEEKADALIKAALEAGGKDNVTVVLFEYLNDELETKTAEAKKEMERSVVFDAAEETYNQANQTAGNSSRKKWPVIVVCLMLVLMAGAFAVFYGLNGKTQKNKGKMEEQQNGCSDSIVLPQNKIDSLKFQDIHPAQGTNAENYSGMQSQIESLQRQNDSLRMKLIESESQKKQLENKVNQFVEELDVLRKSL